MLLDHLKHLYSEEEQNLLTEMLTLAYQQATRGRIEKALKPYIGQSTQVVRDIIMNPLASISEELDRHLREVENLQSEITQISIDQVPLYINDPDILTRTTAIWRLKIGK
jgi:prephenate dehydrogenase